MGKNEIGLAVRSPVISKKQVVEKSSDRTVSKYFAKEKSDASKTVVKQIIDDEEENSGVEVTKNRRSTTLSGDWFGSIEAGATPEGKFIYRTNLEKNEEKE